MGGPKKKKFFLGGGGGGRGPKNSPSDRHQMILLCVSSVEWPRPDLERAAFWSDGKPGNHGEDVKEYYFYLDSAPTHSYMKMLYKYPQAEFPYKTLADENRQRGRSEPEFELYDTGAFRENRYFDIFAEYAKGSDEDIFIRITACNADQKLERCTCYPHFGFAIPGPGEWICAAR